MTEMHGNLIFSHIPKCGGTTFRNILTDLYGRDHLQTIYPSPNEERLKELNDLLSAPNDIHLIMGHFGYGIHQRLKGNFPDSSYITILREPVSRVISLFNYIKRSENNFLYETVKDMSLTEFIESSMNRQIDNFQTRFVSGIIDVDFGKCNEEMLDKALNNLEKEYVSFGIMEMFDESLIVFQHDLHWDNIPYFTKINVNRQKSSVDDYSLDLIRDRNRYDIQLYEIAVERFKTKMATIPQMDQKLHDFTLNNDAFREGFTRGVDQSKQAIPRQMGIKKLTRELLKAVRRKL